MTIAQPSQTSNRTWGVTLTAGLLGLFALYLSYNLVQLYLRLSQANAMPDGWYLFITFAPSTVTVLSYLLTALAMALRWTGWRTYSGILAGLMILTAVTGLAKSGIDLAAGNRFALPVTNPYYAAMLVRFGIAAAMIWVARYEAPGAGERLLASPLRHLFSFDGRVPRVDFWMAGLLILPYYAHATGATYNLAAVINGGTSVDLFQRRDAWLSPFGITAGVFVLGAMVFGFAINARRWHDLGKSGWWQLLGAVPLANFYSATMVSCVRGDQGPNAYGPDPFQHGPVAA